MNDKPHVLIYRDFLLPRSETFIKSQGEGLTRFSAIYTGLRQVDGVSLPSERVVTIQRAGLAGKIESGAFSQLGIAPSVMVRLALLKPRLVHAHFGVDATRVMRLARLLRLPLLATFHDYDVTTSDADLIHLGPYCAQYLRRRPQLNRQAAAFLAVSEFIKRKAVVKGFDPNKIIVHYIGIDVERFNSDLTPKREPMVLFVGRLVEKKGCEYLIRAMQSVQATRPDVELVVAGDGPLLNELQTLAAGCLKRYRFLGAVSSEEVRSLLQVAAVFCLPSVTAASGETEGLPISILEAQAAGVPVVSTTHAGIPEAVLHEQTGLLTAERDPAGLAEQLTRVISNPDLAGRLGAAGRARVNTHFNLQRQIAALEDIYEQISG